MNGHRIVALLFALALLVSTPAGFVGTASATHDCNSLDMFIAVFSAGQVNADKCGGNHTAHVVEDIEESDANQTHVDIYQGAVAQEGLADGYHDAQHNTLNRYGAAAWSQGMAAYAECYENGYSKATCESEMRGEIADSIALKQQNVIEQSDVHTASLDTLRNRSQMEEDLTAEGVFDQNPDQTRDEFDAARHGSSRGKAEDNQTVVHYQVELVNGTTQEADYMVALDYRSGCSCYYEQHIGPAPYSLLATPDDQLSEYDYPNELIVKRPNDNYENRVVYNGNEYGSTLTELNKTNSQLQDNVGKFSDSVWTALENDEIQPSELITHSQMVSEYSSKYQETGYYVYAVAALSQMGLNTPNMNSTAHMTIRYDGEKHTGLLLSDNAPDNGTWVVGQTYNATKIDGIELFVTDQGKQIELSGEFTLVEAVGKDGEQNSVVTVRRTNYVTTNATETKTVLKRTQTTRKIIEQREPDGSTVVPSANDLPVDWRILAGGIVSVIIAVYLLRSALIAEIKY